MSTPLLQMSDVWLRLPGIANRPILAGVDLEVAAGEVVGLVGESGSGKSVTARTALGLVPRGAQVEGRVLVDGTDVLSAPADRLRRLRSESAAMVFQDPRAGINPMRRIGDHLTEAARFAKRGEDVRAARKRALDLLEAVGLPHPERHLKQFPHELSGGMLQRVMIAGALMGSPKLLLCDEPTTALDVTTQKEIVSILARLQQDEGMGMLFITHDLDLAASVCDRVHVMYAGQVVEHASAKELFASPQHPYTAGLLASTPSLEVVQERLRPIAGTPLSLLADPLGCTFAERCDRVMEGLCTTQRPELVEHGDRADRCLLNQTTEVAG
ncbi:ATP-binding cassette domain-containing protein [Nocardioides sp. MAH-18]|uniref:ATP-binding cassette domain-containing protein n=1 Tax=Nocardioides agri TaxID=2682843 RepID=A0A6L6XPN1_9ACTN|nr:MULTISPECIES: ABC transporter ATP-binding protein [unclassified Nocardioides]MBA2953818.1 ABC transporter ATP-binding protein [Nocardioides sp. CGMCC 1.13656]MVQ48683.1 ATP-binding cassette domain-containing protein [Nocardioides sp. MAH-18]